MSKEKLSANYSIRYCGLEQERSLSEQADFILNLQRTSQILSEEPNVDYLRVLNGGSYRFVGPTLFLHVSGTNDGLQRVVDNLLDQFDLFHIIHKPRSWFHRFKLSPLHLPEELTTEDIYGELLRHYEGIRLYDMVPNVLTIFDPIF